MLPSKTVFRIVSAVPPAIAAAKYPEPNEALLFAKVQLTILPPFPNNDSAPPSPWVALLPENVTLVKSRVLPSDWIAPEPVATLFENVEAVITSVELWK